MRHHITLLLCFFSVFTHAEIINFEYNKQTNKYSCSLGKNFSPEAALSLIASDTIGSEKCLACYYHQLGAYYHNKEKNYVASIQYNKQAAELRAQYDDGMLWKSYRNIAFAYYEIDFYKKAVEYIDKAFEVSEKFGKDPTAYIYLSRAHRGLGEYQKGIEKAHKALELSSTEGFEKYKGNALIALCNVLRATNEPQNLNLSIKKANEATLFYKERNSMKGIARAYNAKGSALDKLGSFGLAIQCYQEAQKIYRRINDDVRYALTLNNMSETYSQQNKYDIAIKLLNESLSLKQKHYDTPYHPNYSPNYENLGDSYTGLGEYETAIQNYNKALDNLTDNPKSENPYIYNKPDYIRVLDLKAQALKMKGETTLASQIYQDIDNWITTFYKDLSTNNSKLVWIERAHKIYGNAIEVALMTGDNERAFQYAEKAHAVLLWQNLSQEAALSLLSDEDREKRDHLIAQLHQAERQYKNGKTDLRILRTQEKEQQDFENYLEDEYPEYARRKYQTESTTVAQVKDMIDENTAFIEYYWTDGVLRIFVITKEELTVHTKNAEGLAEQITNLRSIISQPKCDADCAKNNYNSLAFDLYKKLIPNDIQTNTKIDRLVIVADKAIGTLPFSALATQASTENFDVDYPFLLHKYATNYLYSAGSFLQLQQKNTHHTTGFAGFAPVEYHITDRDFLPLYQAEEEVEKIAQMYRPRQRNTYMKTKATKQNFIQALQENHHTLLLATHAQYNNQKGEIAFQSEVMNQNEIDQLKHIRIQRLMLSACQTAEGKQNAGEGILSLGWNFAYKGVPSITMNQWSVNEGATMKIMLTYNKLLRKGIPADQALQDAQINYLNGDIYTRKYYQPYYWAAIVHAGNPVDTKSGIDIYGFDYTISTQHLWWILVVLGLSLVGRVAIRRK